MHRIARQTAVAVALTIAASVSAQNVTAVNAAERSYAIRVDVPDETERKFKRINVQFPAQLGEFEYAYSSVVYSRSGKRILSYRPDASSSSTNVGRIELYILAHEDVLPCLSYVNIYFDRRSKSMHPPERSVQVDLASFVSDKPRQCEGKVDAANFY